jgi:TetR/AcrR family fatty acid metabolism transcriptional regulator
MSKKEKSYTEAREKILNAAARIFGDKGFHKAQVIDIAREAKTSAGSVYTTFKEKYDIFQQITRGTMDEFSAIIGKLDETKTPCASAHRWESAYSAFFDYVDEHPDRTLLILRGGFGVSQEHDTMLWEFIQLLAETIGNEFRKGVKAGCSLEVDCTLQGHIIIGMCRQLTMSYIIDKQFSRDEVINTLTALTEAVVSLYD